MNPFNRVRVVDFTTTIAGPHCTRLLADLGAEIIKIESPEGDLMRSRPPLRNGASTSFGQLNAGKKSVVLDLKQKPAVEIARRLAVSADIVVENYRPGVMRRFGLDHGTLKSAKPDLIYCAISGYGQTGPYRERPGFAAIGEAMGGMRYITGFPDRPPVRPNLSVGDTLASLHGVIGALLALHHVQKGNQGQVIDVALYESVFNITESLLPEYDAQAVIRERSGSALPGIAPSNLYPCRDGAYVLIAGNADALFKRLMSAIGREDLRDDPALAKNDGRAAQMARIDDAISAWTSRLSQNEVLEAMEKAEVPAGRIYTAADIAADPHYAARGMIQDIVAGDGEPLKVPGVIPKLSATPGAIRSPAPKLGEHTEQVLGSIGLSSEDISRLREKRII